ncbi:DUF2165 family protein [Melaminivora suipulveris]|uniref:DUF2165 family protein n=1 Tax=Melaminivora suipulveris TaxID=2109913 RepID=UPI0018F88B43|nr:DUF2165 domain-containing protein [Melaminivora suipulveris]
MLMTRCAKAAMTACLAAFAAMVAFNNLVDYRANLAFVQHVLAMDDIFEGSRHLVRWRTIQSPFLWHALYGLIIAGELATAALLGRGAWALWRARRAPAAQFARAKRWTITGVLAGFVLWFLGFMVIGGEWFLMWQSPTWNGQASAFRFYMTLLAVGIFVNQGDGELEPAP